jgi:membrane-associated PAP2 superfamily phosphatase
MRLLLVIASAALAIVALATWMHPLDQQVADLAFESQTPHWLVSHSGWLRAMFYDGPKQLLVLLGLLLLAAVLFPRLPVARALPKPALRFLLLCLLFVPATTGLIKSMSGVSCPYAISRYGGLMPDENSVFSMAGFNNPQRSDGCWPSGHVSGAFALLGLLVLPIPRRRAVAAGVLSAGMAMGAYQVLRGAHYPSHILVSLFIAVMVIAVLQRLMLPGAHGEVSGTREPTACQSLRRLRIASAQNSISIPVAGNNGNQ